MDVTYSDKKDNIQKIGANTTETLTKTMRLWLRTLPAMCLGLNTNTSSRRVPPCTHKYQGQNPCRINLKTRIFADKHAAKMNNIFLVKYRHCPPPV